MDSHQRDLQLVQRWSAGDEAAAHQLVSENHEKILGFIAKLVIGKGIHENMEDLIHDVYHDALVRALGNAQSFDGTCSFYTWVCSISRLCFLEHRRELAKHRHVELSEKITDGVDSVDNSCFGDPETIYLQKEQRELVFRALNSLKEEYKEIILLRQVEYKNYAEIEKKTGKSTPALESLYRRATNAFRKKYCELNRKKLPNGFSAQRSLNR